jgi:cation:H+ antiporter
VESRFQAGQQSRRFAFWPPDRIGARVPELWLRAVSAAWPKYTPRTRGESETQKSCSHSSGRRRYRPRNSGTADGGTLGPGRAGLDIGPRILSASFLLLWACDAAQSEISQSLALAVVALIAVLPEYAVDMYFTWQAGRFPESDYAHFAVANMTGANRLLIGVGWGAIAVLYWIRFRRPVRIEKDRKRELSFLGLATICAFLIPIKGSLAWYDGVVFVGLYLWYLRIAGQRPSGDFEAEGPAELLVQLPKSWRRLATGGLFLFAAGAILANAEPFCEGLVGTGRMLKINEFLLVQWLAPIASEAPEFVVALMFAWRGQAGLALGSLISAKLNQWTLLVGMIPGVFAVSHGSLAHPMPMGDLQMFEILLTAAQSLLAVVLLAAMRFSLGGATLLFALFIGQLMMPAISGVFPRLALGLSPAQIHPVYAVLYGTTAFALVALRPRRLLRLIPFDKSDRPAAICHLSSVSTH